ncbi:MAG TPA: hypothetical protein VF209_04955 [Patescibacteria group bacterium]
MKKVLLALIFSILFTTFTTPTFAQCARGTRCATEATSFPITCPIGTSNICCSDTSSCAAEQQAANPTTPPQSQSDTNSDSILNWDQINPLKIEALKSEEVTVQEDLTTFGGVMSRFLVFAFPAAGLILFVMIFWGGFEMLSGAASKKSMDAGKQRITAAVVGFLLLFISFWLVRLLEAIFGISVF